ncbi:cell wall-binding repeat-containing protein [Herbiconiux sp. CPCC 205716]|uniref:Cell wall-binding repeat-containing protein n=1 Tax=Herbiconiux gentiana TaxID=2970912 RepID=A0ABT2GHU8_9MICO|nr:cell wall-binding repeat-containing protein [Herbiconiux gentiana]MCS5715797.1 cell wall-binding repeat-containing protein [Herbiconiux gentiana]
MQVGPRVAASARRVVAVATAVVVAGMVAAPLPAVGRESAGQPTPHLVEFELPSSKGAPNDVVAGADGTVWVSVFNDKQIVHVNRDGTVRSVVPLSGGPTSLASDWAGGVWATEFASNAIVHVDDSGLATEYPVPTPAAMPANIVEFRGYVYFTESNTQKLGRFHLATKTMVEYPLVGSVTPWDLRGDLATGSLYITDTGTGTVWKRSMDGADQGSFAAASGVSSFGHTVGFGDPVTHGYSDGQIDELDPAAGTRSTVVSGRTEIAGVVAGGGSPAEVWFVDRGTDSFVVVDDTGATQEFPLPGTGRGLSGLTMTDGRYLWSAERSTGKLARIDVVAAIVTDRLGGATRYETAVQVSTDAYPTGAAMAFVTSGETFADALSAGPVAGLNHAPLLLTPRAGLAPVVRDELVRLGPSRVIVVGGPVAVSEGAFDAIRAALPDASVERIGGADRYAVSSALIASSLVPRGSEKIYLATGRDFPDALSAAPRAVNDKTAVLLVDGKSDRLNAAQSAAIATQLTTKDGRPKIVGGPQAVSPELEASVRASYSTVQRFGGQDRFEVSTAINMGWTAGPPYIASGAGFADALTGGAVAGAQGRSIILSRQECLPPAALAMMITTQTRRATLLGGEAALAPAVKALTVCP